jgi:8-oxo-dGTP diphosphatase
MQNELPNLTVTFLIEYEGKFLLISRSGTENHFPSLWAFPGGKVEIGETVIDTITREVLEETGLHLKEDAFFLDSYYFKKSVGIAFLVRATNNFVSISDEIEDFRWIETIDELKMFDCIPGIHNHLQRAIGILNKGHFDSLTSMNLTPNKYLNK